MLPIFSAETRSARPRGPATVQTSTAFQPHFVCERASAENPISGSQAARLSYLLKSWMESATFSATDRPPCVEEARLVERLFKLLSMTHCA